jgi:hypothetical protein
MKYEDYLKSTHWKEFKASYMAQWRKPHCAFCRARRRLNLHHVDYSRLGREEFDDVLLLCVDCHEEVHQMKKDHPDLTLREATRRVKRQIKPRGKMIKRARRWRSRQAWLSMQEIESQFENAISE